MESLAATAPLELASLAELRARHLELLEAWDPERAAAQAPQAEGLRRGAQALGAWLDDPDERDRAQGIIDYWTAALTGLPGYAFPDLLRLEPFDPARAADMVGWAEALIAPHAGTGFEEQMEEMLLALVRPGPQDRIVARSRVERGDLIPADKPPETAARLAAFLDELVAKGVVRRIPAEDGREESYELTFSSVARSCPRLRTRLDKRRAANTYRDRLKATAHLWKDSGDTGYLLGGDVLNQAGGYFGDDPLIDRFIAASRRAANRKRYMLIAAYILGPILAVVIGIWFYKVGEGSWYDSDLNQIAESEIDQEAGNVMAGRPDPRARDAAALLGVGELGFLWAGSSESPTLLDPETGQPADPATIRPGRSYRTSQNIWLRSGTPDQNYTTRPAVSVAPAGSLVVIRSDAASFERPSGRQYWVPVRVVPRVYIHAANARPGQLEPLKTALRRAGFETPPVGPDRGAIGRREISIHKSDGELAGALAQIVAQTGRGRDGAPPPLTCRVVEQRTAPSLVELRLDMRDLQFGPPRQVRVPPISCD